MSRPKRKRPRLGPPRHDSAAIDPVVVEAVTRADRAWFDARPGETVLWRRMAPGETVVDFPAPPGHVWLVEVTQLRRGTRTRRAHLAVEEGLS